MPAIEFKTWFSDLLLRLAQSRQRQLVWLQGPRAWCDARAADLRGLHPEWPLLSNRAALTPVLGLDSAVQLLGSEHAGLVLDGWRGFDPDVLCIATGTLSAGGVLVLLAPDVDELDPADDDYACWQDNQRSPRLRFAEYLQAAVLQDPQLGLRIRPDTALPTIPELPQLEDTPIRNGVTEEQRRTLRVIEPWLDSGDGGLVVLEADRGRGKSSCLGLLLRARGCPSDWIVSAASRKAAQVLLDTAGDAEFIAPDRLLDEAPPASLLLVDEAAMIPQSLLLQLCRRYPRVIMTTTTGGYEGTGRGFRLRFIDRLDDRSLLRITLERPVRWCQGDRLEAWVEKYLLPPELPAVSLAEEGYTIERIEEPGHPQHRQRLRELYALLAAAHYRTRPSDLRQLMENPALIVFAAQSGGRIVGVILLNPEGGFAPALAAEIYCGRRRPRGHLLAQMITAQAGLEEFARYQGLRVQRIAVAATCRRQGIGRALVDRAQEYAKACDLDYLGASFALDADTSGFWRATRYRFVHASYAAGKSSGDHSVAVVLSLSSILRENIRLLSDQRCRQLPMELTQRLRRLEHRQVVALLRLAEFSYRPSRIELEDLDAFVRGRRPFDLCFASLQPLVMSAIAHGRQEIPALLVEKAVQNRPWRQLPRESGDEGRKQLQQRLRHLVDDLMKAC